MWRDGNDYSVHPSVIGRRVEFPLLRRSDQGAALRTRGAAARHHHSPVTGCADIGSRLRFMISAVGVLAR
jgi:hypothetical protein